MCNEHDSDALVDQLLLLRPQTGDILVLRHPVMDAQSVRAMIDNLTECVKRGEITNPVIMLPDGFNLECWRWSEDGRLSKVEEVESGDQG